MSSVKQVVAWLVVLAMVALGAMTFMVAQQDTGHAHHMLTSTDVHRMLGGMGSRTGSSSNAMKAAADNYFNPVHVHVAAAGAGAGAGASTPQPAAAAAAAAADEAAVATATEAPKRPTYMYPVGRDVLCKNLTTVAASEFSPKIIFVAGVEGSGHHGLIPVIRDMLGMNFIRPAEHLLTDLWDPTVNLAKRAEIRQTLLKRLQEHFDRCVGGASDPATECSHFM